MKTLLIAMAALLPAWTAAAAQESRDIRVRVGLGAELQPRFPGSNDTELGPLFHVNIAHGTNEFRFNAPDDSPGIAVVSNGGFSFGPDANLTSKRRNSDLDAPVGTVARTIEVGAFAQYEWRDTMRIRAEIRKGINGHEGVVGMVGADKIWRDGDRYLFSIGPRILFSDARYQRAYFGVTPAAALASGLPTYSPRGGVYALAITSGALFQLNSRWGVFGFARYERLIGDAAKSPIIRELGSRNQVSGGIGLNYIFVVRR